MDPIGRFHSCTSGQLQQPELFPSPRSCDCLPHHGASREMCSTSPVIAALPYLPMFDGNAMPATSAQPETPWPVTSIGFSPVLSPIQKSSPHKVAIRNSPSKTTQTPRNWRHCNQQVCPLMVTSAFKGVSHGCNQWPQRPSFVPNDNISRPLLGEQVELQAARCRLFGVLPHQSGDGSKTSCHIWGD